MKDGKVRQVFSRSGYQWDGGRHKVKMNEGEYGGCVLYSCMKIEE
jgi:hypothetical protein